MKPFFASYPALAFTALLLLGGSLQKLHAQSFCASDGQPRPAALLERFINADCESCWSDPQTPQPGRREIALDWVLPGDKGDDAPLSAVASRDALARLEALKQPVPAHAWNSASPVRAGQTGTLRVAHGLALSGYMGASIELKPAPQAATDQRWTAWLALVETLPVGAEGTPVERNLVRNVLQASWNVRKQLSKEERKRFFESRAMSLPEGVNPQRVRVIGWVQDEQGRVLAAAQSRCTGR